MDFYGGEKSSLQMFAATQKDVCNTECPCSPLTFIFDLGFSVVTVPQPRLRVRCRLDSKQLRAQCTSEVGTTEPTYASCTGLLII